MKRTTLNLRKKKDQSQHSKQPSNNSLAQYVGYFALGYIIATAIFMMIQNKFTLSSQLVMVLSILLGAYVTVYKFTKHQHRSLYSSEINRLAFGSTGVVWLLSALYFLILWLWLFDAISREVLLDMASQQPLPLLGALIMMLLLTLISARLGLWAFNRLLAPKHKSPVI